MSVTVNKGEVMTAWHDIIRGREKIDEEESRGLEESSKIGIARVQSSLFLNPFPFLSITSSSYLSPLSLISFIYMPFINIVEDIIEREVKESGIGYDKIFLAGFSQGKSINNYLLPFPFANIISILCRCCTCDPRGLSVPS